MEIGSLYKGKGKAAQESYIDGIAEVLNNCKRFLVEDYDVLKDNRTDKMYKPIYDNNEVRPGVNIVLDKDNFSVKITTTENVVGNC